MNLIMSEEECETPGFQRQTLKNEVNVEPCDMQGRQPGGSRRVWCCTRLLQRASACTHIFSCIVFYIFFFSPALQPPFDLSFEAERMFTSNPQWNKLAVCTQPSVQPRPTPRGEGRRERNLSPVLLSGRWGGQKLASEKRLGPLPDNSNHFTYEWLGSQVVPDGVFCCSMDSGMSER